MKPNLYAQLNQSLMHSENQVWCTIKHKPNVQLHISLMYSET